MNIDILTIFPEIFDKTLNFSIIKRARDKKKVDFNIINIRNFTDDKHKTVDDVPFGGMPGMVMKIEPLYYAIKNMNYQKNKRNRIILLSASGKKLTQNKLVEYSQLEKLAIICGRYEGVDERILNFIDEEISIGDYVISGGEFAALVIIEGVVRLLPGVLGNEESIKNESFNNDLLDFPHYTRPREFMGLKAPEVLFSGNHKKINEWMRKAALKKTFENRPDILKNIKLTEEEKKFLENLKKGVASDE
jgi:tRNA (guanine37-N1)-methyltransferase